MSDYEATKMNMSVFLFLIMMIEDKYIEECEKLGIDPNDYDVYTEYMSRI